MFFVEQLPSTQSGIAVAILLLLPVYYVLTSLIAWSRLRHFPGPPIASFSYFWLGRAAVSGKAFKIYLDAQSRYGKHSPLIRVGPDILMTDSPEIHRQINGARSGYTKAEWYNAMRLDPYIETMITTRNVEFHDDTKARTAAGYSGKEVPTLERDLDEQLANFKDLIRRKYISTSEKTRPMEFAAASQYFTLDSLTKVAFGKEWGYMAADKDVNGYIKTMEDMGLMIALCADVPWMGRIFLSDFMLKLIGPKKTDKWGIGVMMGVAESVVDKRFGPDAEEHKDMLGSFIRHGVERKQCQGEILEQVITGSDTTANVIRITMLFLMTAPHVYYRLQREIDQGIANGKISTPVTSAEGKALPYLQAVILESLRVHPPIAFQLSKVVPPEGDTLDGKFVPGGTKISMNKWAMFRRTEIFGEDSAVFRPERWLEASPEKRFEMDRTSEQLFGFGRYGCAGRVLASMELNKTFVELLRDFDFQILDPSSPWHESQQALFMHRDFWLRITERVQ